MKRIESPKNPTVKALLKLRERRARERGGRYLIEGARELSRALAAGVPLEQLGYAEALLGDEGRAVLADPRAAALPRLELSEAAFARVSLRQHPDGVLAVARTAPTTLSELRLPENALVLVLDGLEKPGNLGALLRTADAADLAAVFVTGVGTDLYNPNVIRSSVGSVFSRPVVAAPSEELLGWLLERGVTLVAATPHASQSYWEADYRGPSAIVLGAEDQGLGEVWLAGATQVAIPMRGLADSLNVATAGALLVYEALRQRHGASGTQNASGG